MQYPGCGHCGYEYEIGGSFSHEEFGKAAGGICLCVQCAYYGYGL